jgi:hypothetical protein
VITAPRPLNSEERRQREHELTEALIAARHLQARLEMLGDHPTAVHVVQVMRNGLAHELASLSAADAIEIGR